MQALETQRTKLLMPNDTLVPVFPFKYFGKSSGYFGTIRVQVLVISCISRVSKPVETHNIANFH